MIIFLHGDDTYRSREKLRELREKFVREVDPSGSNLVVIDGATAEASEMWGAIAAQSFLVRKRMVVVEDIGAAKSDAVREEVAVFLPKVPDDVVAVFWEAVSRESGVASRENDVGAGRKFTLRESASRTGPRPRKGKAESLSHRRGGALSPPARKADPLFPLLLKEKYAQEFTPLQGAELERWVTAYATARSATFAPGACRELCAIVGGDLWRMAQEVEKLTMAASGFSSSHREGELEGVGVLSRATPPTPPSKMEEGKQSITSPLIRALVAAAPTDDIFAFVDALGRGDQASAIRELQRLEAKEQKPEYLMAMITRQLRLLLIAADSVARGESSAATIAALGGSPFVARKVMEQARRHSVASLRALYPKLLDLDLALKSSRAPKPALLEAFVLEAITPA